MGLGLVTVAMEVSLLVSPAALTEWRVESLVDKDVSVLFTFSLLLTARIGMNVYSYDCVN